MQNNIQMKMMAMMKMMKKATQTGKSSLDSGKKDESQVSLMDWLIYIYFYIFF